MKCLKSHYVKGRKTFTSKKKTQIFWNKLSRMTSSGIFRGIKLSQFCRKFAKMRKYLPLKYHILHFCQTVWCSEYCLKLILFLQNQRKSHWGSNIYFDKMVQNGAKSAIGLPERSNPKRYRQVDFTI